MVKAGDLVYHDTRGRSSRRYGIITRITNKNAWAFWRDDEESAKKPEHGCATYTPIKYCFPVRIDNWKKVIEDAKI